MVVDESRVVLTPAELKRLRADFKAGQKIRKGWETRRDDGHLHLLTYAELAIICSEVEIPETAFDPAYIRESQDEKAWRMPAGKLPSFVQYDPAKETPDEALKRSRALLPDNTLRDHVNDLVMQVLAREKAKGNIAPRDARFDDLFDQVQGQSTSIAVLEERTGATLLDQFAMAAPMPDVKVLADSDEHRAALERHCWMRYQFAAEMIRARSQKIPAQAPWWCAPCGVHHAGPLDCPKKVWG